MQLRRNQRRSDMSKPALPSTRTQSAREAVLRVTQELLQSHVTSFPKEQVSNDGCTAEIAPIENAGQSTPEQKTRLLGAIQPVLNVVADSIVRHSDPNQVQL